LKNIFKIKNKLDFNTFIPHRLYYHSGEFIHGGIMNFKLAFCFLLLGFSLTNCKLAKPLPRKKIMDLSMVGFKALNLFFILKMFLKN
jgi:hypothetical protein